MSILQREYRKAKGIKEQKRSPIIKFTPTTKTSDLQSFEAEQAEQVK